MSKRNRRRSHNSFRQSARPLSTTLQAASRGTESQSANTNSYWELSPKAGSHELGLVATSLADIADSASRLNQLAAGGQASLSTFQRESRRISVQVRKLILDGDEQLLKRCFVPRLHPLKAPQYRGQDVLTEWVGNMSIVFQTEGSSGEESVTLPTEHTHETMVRPLYGLRKIREKEYQLAELFDWSSQMLRLGQWLNSKVFQVDDTILTAGQLLRMMVNREGAHSDPNELLTFNLSGPVKLTIGDPTEEGYRRANCIKFNGMTYPQIFTYLVGLYLVSMMKASLRHIPQEIGRVSASTEIWRTIMDGPPQPLRQPMHLDKDYAMGAVIHNTGRRGESFVLVGDYEQPSSTLVQIPDWE